MENENLEEKIKSYHEKIRSLEKESCRIGGEICNLTREYAEMVQKDDLKNIGRCFKYYSDKSSDVPKAYVRITDVPQIDEYMTGPSFNESQYLAFYIKVENENYVNRYNKPHAVPSTPFYYGNFFTGNFKNDGKPWEKWEEISDEEFREFFSKKLSEFEKNILNCIDKPE